MRYKYVGPYAVDLPTLDLWDIEPGQVVNVPADAGLDEHGHFEAVKAAPKETSK